MQAAVKGDYVSVADYLSEEAASDQRHEYLGGLVYAMAGETRDHNSICLNLASFMRGRLKGKPCQVYMGNVRVNFHLRDDEYYYYPDVVVTCDRRDNDQRFVRYPKLIVEVLSETTQRVDKREKFLAYTTIESLEEYLLVAQDKKEITVFRRDHKWKAEVVAGAKAAVTLASLGIKLPLSAIYEGV